MRRAASLLLLLSACASAPPLGAPPAQPPSAPPAAVAPPLEAPVPAPPPPSPGAAEEAAPPSPAAGGEGAAWDNAWRGEVRVVGTVTVPKGCSLTLLPGTVVLLSPGASIDVAGGRFVAEGTDGAPVRLLPAEPGALWGGVRLVEAEGGSRISRCVVEGAEAVSMEKCSVPVRDSRFFRGRTGLVLSTGASPAVEGNEFREMEECGLSCEREAQPLVEGNRFVLCGTWGLFSHNESRPVVRGNAFLRCAEGLHVKGDLDRPVAGNRFAGNKLAVATEGAAPSTRIEGNRFEGNESGIVCFQSSSPTIEGNRFLGNGKAIGLVRSSSPSVLRNEIAGNGDGLFATGLSTPRVEGNDFRDNGRSVALDMSSYAVLRGNNFDGPGIRVELLPFMSADWEHRVREKPIRGWLARHRERVARGVAAAAAPTLPEKDPEEGLDGLVDASGNWWGEEATAEMERLGAEGNVSSIVDGHDTPVRRYDGFEGEFVQDRVNYSGWAKARIAGTGVPAPSKEEGTP